MNDDQELVFYVPKSYFAEKMVVDGCISSDKNYAVRRKSFWSATPARNSRTSSAGCLNVSPKQQEHKSKRFSHSFLDHLSQQFKDVSVAKTSSLDRLASKTTNSKRAKSTSAATELLDSSSNFERLKGELKRTKSNDTVLKYPCFQNQNSLQDNSPRKSLSSPDAFHETLEKNNRPEVLIKSDEVFI